jgi:hypothetical protein
MVLRAIVVALALCATPQLVYADAIVQLFFSNGQAWLEPHDLNQYGFGDDGDFEIDVGTGPQLWDEEASSVSFDISSNDLRGHTLITDAAGTVTDSVYRYDSAELIVFFYQLVGLDGQGVEGLFRARITDVRIEVNEVDETGVAFYTLGRGFWTPELAQALGVRRKTAGGEMISHLSPVRGSYLDDTRQGLDSARFIVNVPEPSTLLLLLVGAAGLIGRRRFGTRPR